MPRAVLAGAVLRRAKMRRVNLQGADLSRACLCAADLSGASLKGANLGKADLRGACLAEADFRSANLYGANLAGASMAGARFDGADLAAATLPDGKLFTDDACLERFTQTDHPAFLATQKKIAAINAMRDVADETDDADAEKRRLPWKQFLDETYGSLADDPIEWRASVIADSEAAHE